MEIQLVEKGFVGIEVPRANERLRNGWRVAGISNFGPTLKIQWTKKQRKPLEGTLERQIQMIEGGFVGIEVPNAIRRLDAGWEVEGFSNSGPTLIIHWVRPK